MSTPAERIAALDLAIKATNSGGLISTIKVDAGTEWDQVNAVVTVAKDFEAYISGDEPKGLKFHDGDVEHHEPVIETRDEGEVQCRRCGVKRSAHSPYSTHVFEEQLVFDGVEPTIIKSKPIVDVSLCAVSGCKRKMDHFVHLPEALGHGGHEFVSAT